MVVIKFAIVQLLSCVWLFVTPWTGAHQASLSFTVSRNLFKFMFTKLVMTSSRLILCHPSFPPVLNLFQDQGLFQWVGSSPQVAKGLEPQLHLQSFQWIFRTDFLYYVLVWSPCRPRDSQEPSPTPQFRSINSLALSFLHSPTLTSIHDHWKKLDGPLVAK